MEKGKFNAIAERGISMLRALMTLGPKHLPGESLCYNAYFRGTEVVVLGYRFSEGAHSYTKPVAILVDEDVFDELRVDDESGRRRSGEDAPKRVL